MKRRTFIETSLATAAIAAAPRALWAGVPHSHSTDWVAAIYGAQSDEDGF